VCVVTMCVRACANVGLSTIVRVLFMSKDRQAAGWLFVVSSLLCPCWGVCACVRVCASACAMGVICYVVRCKWLCEPGAR
jgi:hypothetical protein